jgi:hypothetical protein
MILEPAVRIRSAASLAATATAVAVLAGCGSDDPASTPLGAGVRATTSATPVRSAESFDVEAAVNQADAAPYSAAIKTETYIDGILSMTMTGRINLNGPSPGM